MESGFPALISLPELFGSETLTWVVLGLGIYWAAVIGLRNADLLPDYVGTQGPILTFHTKRGREFLDWLSGPKRFWRAFANVGIGVSLVVMVAMFGFLLLAAIAAFSSPEPAASEVQTPRNVLVIPGVNDFLPLSAAPGIVFGLLVGLVVHEGAHGLLCRVEDIEIESMGVAMLAIIPFGAFVEPDHESSKEASRGGQTRMFAAGVTANFLVTIIVFALLFGPIAGSIAVAPGAAVGGVEPGTPADQAGIEPGDRITALEGDPVDDNEDLVERFDALDGETISLEVNGDETLEMDRELQVIAPPGGAPVDLESGDVIVAVDGESVETESDFFAAIGDEERVTLTVEPTDDGDTEEREIPIGGAVSVVDDGPLESALEADYGTIDEPFVITQFADERVHSYEDVDALIGEHEPGDEVVVAGYLDDERLETTVTLGEHTRQSGTAFLGVTPLGGTSGVDFSPIGIQLYPAEEFLVMLGGEGDGSFTSLTDSFLGKVAIALLLPIAGVVDLLPYNFAGFTGGIENFFVATGPLAGLGDGTVFVIANLLFWTGWINVQLGFFNLIPAFPLDGGHILRTTTEAILSRLPIDATRGMVRAVTTTVGLTMLFSFLAMLFIPWLLAS
ncbi:site-2 protease family protein [Natrarchaeobaculum aegyptiacum]|uniref:Metalloprotease n=1 Tax=Natrarchaeobaculum aegyptiacum TaxID=745377 RepID=A0A2Z2I177_9EURY|nr:site-2 protease family protein [Natrarchaeobaculum aegyptiacum]ARS90128.1 metalloprotease [Natrarchaeobaculum aegyptiacum]